MKNVLLSAYACEPNKGSEPEVGWKTCIKLAEKIKGNIFVITRSNNKEKIEEEIIKSDLKNITFIYYDLPRFVLKFKKKLKFNQIYYFFWQIGLAFKINKIVNEYNIDIVNHVTFASYKVFSALAFANKPFILGPVGGGERASYKYYKNIPIKSFVKEIIRDIDIIISTINPLNRYTFNKANKILVTTKETYKKIPKKYRYKCEIQQAIGLDITNKRCIKSYSDSKKIRFLYVGNIVYWKGVYILIDAIKRIKKDNFKVTIVGDGPDKIYLEKDINYLGDKIEFLGRKNRDEVLDIYTKSDVLVFPSLHDSGAMVILEAMSFGVPTVCLNFGGPAVNVIDGINGYVIKSKDYSEVVEKLACRLEELIDNPNQIYKLREGCFSNIDKYSWDSKIAKIEEVFNFLKNENYE